MKSREGKKGKRNDGFVRFEIKGRRDESFTLI
jgi:hypothetical protein